MRTPQPLFFLLRWHWGIGLAGLLLLSACHQKTNTAPTVPANVTGPPYLELSAHPRVGVIAWIHPEGHTVLIERDPHVADVPAGGRLISRDADFVPKAVLEITGEPKGRFQPARVLGGTIALDQGVVAPGPTLQEWGTELLKE